MLKRQIRGLAAYRFQPEATENGQVYYVNAD